MKKHSKIIMLLLMLLVAALSTFPLTTETQAATPKISRTKAALTKGKQLKLKVTGTKKKPKWSSDKKKVATVTNKGVVKAKSKGTARITAKVGKKKLVCRVAVEAPELNKKILTITVGKTASLKLDGTKGKVNWNTTDPRIATISKNGTVKAIKPGSCGIYAQVYGKLFLCIVNVKISNIPSAPTDTPVSTPTITQTETPTPTSNPTLSPEATNTPTTTPEITNTPTYIPPYIPNPTFVPTNPPENTPIPTQTPKPIISPDPMPSDTPEPGSKLELNLSSEYQKVKVNKNGSLAEECCIKIESVLFDGENITQNIIYPTYTPTPVLPGDTSPQTLYIGFEESYGVSGIWDNSSKEYAITSFNPYSEDSTTGYVDVIASYGIHSATKRFIIEKDLDYVQIIPVECFQFNQETLRIYEGESQKLSYLIIPENATDKTVSFSSSDEQIASVGDDGTVEAKMPGECTLTATCGGIKASCTLMVNKKFVVEDAQKSLTYESFIMENPNDGGVVVIAKNNYKYAMTIMAKCRFYDGSGNLIGDSGSAGLGNNCLESGKESYFYIKGPYNPSRYEVYFEIQESNYEGKTDGIKIMDSQMDSRTVIAKVKNDSSINSFTEIACIFYKNEVPVGFDEKFAYVEYIGAEDDVEFYCLTQDENGNQIEPDSYRLNIQYSYKTP